MCDVAWLTVNCFGINCSVKVYLFHHLCVIIHFMSSLIPSKLKGAVQYSTCLVSVRTLAIWSGLCLSLGNDFFFRCWQVTTWRSTARRAALWLRRALLALSNNNLAGVAGFQLAAVHTEQLAGAAGKDRAEWRWREELLVVVAVKMKEGREGGSGEEELLRALGGFSVVVPHKCIQALQDKPLTGMRDGEHEQRGRGGGSGRVGGGTGLGSRSWPVVPDACSKRGCDLLRDCITRFTPWSALELHCRAIKNFLNWLRIMMFVSELFK